MGAALRCLCNIFGGSNCLPLMISQSDVESGLMSHSARAAVSEIDQKKVCLPGT